jgi:glycosyltransferase involved in cell wall biosynthesis
MRIAIDARMMGAENTRGIGRYIYETVEAMRRVAPEHELILLQPPVRWYTIAEQLKMPGIFHAAKADIVWVPHWNVPIFYRGPLAITVHDLLLLHQPVSTKASTRGPLVAWLKRFGHRIVLRNALHRASVILVPTKCVARDIGERYSFTDPKIVVTGEGVSTLPYPHESSPVAGPYLFSFGSAYPHKRIDLLLEMWPRLSSIHPRLSLVIGGERDVFMKRLMDFASRKNLSRIHFPGRLSDQELTDHLSHAEAHVHPSSFEGFALPSLEALSMGCPTVVSDIPLMREVLPEEGVFFFKNGDANDMIRAIETVLKDREVAHAAARRGGEEAKHVHDWNVVAERTLAALRSAARVR